MNKQDKSLLCIEHQEEAVLCYIEPGLFLKEALICLRCFETKQRLFKIELMSEMISWMYTSKIFKMGFCFVALKRRLQRRNPFTSLFCFSKQVSFRIYFVKQKPKKTQDFQLDSALQSENEKNQYFNLFFIAGVKKKKQCSKQIQQKKQLIVNYLAFFKMLFFNFLALKIKNQIFPFMLCKAELSQNSSLVFIYTVNSLCKAIKQKYQLEFSQQRRFTFQNQFALQSQSSNKIRSLPSEFALRSQIACKSKREKRQLITQLSFIKGQCKNSGSNQLEVQKSKDEALSRKFEQISILQRELEQIQKEIMEFKNRQIQLCDLILLTTATWLENLNIATPQLSVFEDLEIFYSNNFQYFYEQDLETISSGFLRKLKNVFDQIQKNTSLLEIQERLKRIEQRHELKKQIPLSYLLNKYQLRTQEFVPKTEDLKQANPHNISEPGRNYQQYMQSQDEQFSCFRKINERVYLRNNNQKTHKVDQLEKLCLNDNERQMIFNEEIKAIRKNSAQSLQINRQHIINLRLEKFNSIIACSKEQEIVIWVQQNQHYIVNLRSLF